MIFHDSPNYPLTLLTRLAKRQGQAAIWLKSALARDPGRLAPVALDVAVAQGDPIGKILAEIIRESPSLDLALDLTVKCSLSEYCECICLTEAGEAAAQKIIQHITGQNQDHVPNHAQQELLALACASTSGWLSLLGKPEDAIESARKALSYYGDLAKKERKVFLPLLVASLDNIAERFASLGRLEDALEATESAIRLRRNYLQESSAPEDYIPSTVNYVRILTSLGRADEVETSARRIVENIRPVAAGAASPRSLRRYALGLATLGDTLTALDLHDEALAVTAEAAEQYRVLVEDAPETYLPDLALTLGDLGVRFSCLERWEEAFEAANEACDYNSRLAQTLPVAFVPRLIANMTFKGRILHELGRRSEALVITRQAFEKCDEFPELEASLSKQNIAGVTQNLALLLSDLGLLDDAQDLLTSAVEIFRDLVKKNTGVRSDFARCLQQLGLILAELRRPDEAFETLTEAMVQYALLAKQRPEAHLSDFEACVDTFEAVRSR